MQNLIFTFICCFICLCNTITTHYYISVIDNTVPYYNLYKLLHFINIICAATTGGLFVSYLIQYFI